jgi:hypothetical protein
VTRLVAAALLVWEPLNFAAAALTVLPTIAYRGWPAALELTVHGFIAAVAAAGGLALWDRRPSATRLASLALVLSAVRTIQSLYWSTLPTHTMPGDEPFIAGVTVALTGMALAIVHFTRSARAFQ